MKEKENNNQKDYVNNYLISAFEKLGKKQIEVINDTKKPQPYVSALMKGKKKVGKDIAKLLHDLYGFNEGAILTGEIPVEIIPNAHPKEYATHIPVRVVTTKARAGFSDSYYAEEYLKDMPTVLVESDKDYKGRYLAFEVDGDSMEPDYYAGDIVICRELERDKWQYKLHYEQYDFVIAHGTQGIMLKQITDHNLETKEITCHSLNQEGGRNKDFKLKLGEVAFLYNVVEYRQSGKNKRQNR